MTMVTQAGAAAANVDTSDLSLDAVEVSPSKNPDLERPLAIGSGSVKIGTETSSFDYEVRKGDGNTPVIQVEAQTPSAKLFGGIGVALAAFGLNAALPAQNAEGALMRDGLPSAMAEAHAEPYAGSALWIKSFVPDGRWTFASAVRLDEWHVLTAAHVVRSSNPSLPYTSFQVGNGSNLFTDPGDVRQVANVTVHPSYDGSWVRDSKDVAIVTLTSPLSGPTTLTGRASASSSVATAGQEGDVVTSIGYGRFGTPSIGLLPADGKRRAWDAPVYGYGSQSDQLLSDAYAILEFSNNTGLDFRGEGKPGDSGSGGFIGDRLSFLIVGGTTGTSDFEQTFALDLSTVDGWIGANVPEPSSALLSGGLVTAVLLRRQRREKI